MTDILHNIYNIFKQIDNYSFLVALIRKIYKSFGIYISHSLS